MYSALRKATPTTQTFWGCDETDTGGVLGVRIDGATDFTGDTLAAENDYTGLVTATGLSGTHTYQMTLDGTPVGTTYSFIVEPESGDKFDLIFIGDTNTSVDLGLTAILAAESPAACFGGELYYLDGLFPSYDNPYGATVSFPVNFAEYRDETRSRYRGLYVSESERLTFMNSFPIYNSPGNHDVLAGDSANAPGLCRYDGAQVALEEYASNGMPDPVGTVDSEPDKVRYYTKVIGDIEIIVTDGLTYSGGFAAGNLNGTTATANNVGEDKQVAWVKARINASTANVIIVFHTTLCFSADFTRDILPWLDSNHTDKPIFFVCPDSHNGYALERKQAAPNNPMLEVGCSPSTTVGSSKVVKRQAQDVIYFSDAENSTTLTAQALLGATTLNVVDSSIFTIDKVADLSFAQTARVVSSIPSGTSIVIADGTLAQYEIGEVVKSIEWPNDADVAAKNKQWPTVNYVKVIRRPNGNYEDSNPHTEIQVKGTFTEAIRWRCRIRDGERTVRLYTSYGKQTLGL